ncbi:MAG: radical SAM family heme chaperone HemW [Chloroflexota bacterium]
MVIPNAFQDSLSLYLHIPFCGTRCTYCAFNTYTNVEILIPAYVDAMCRELRWLGHGTAHPLHTIYFGGGTPSLLSAQQVSAILETCRHSFTVLPTVEITLEANPGSIGADYADGYFAQLRETGINRLSIGMQSAQAGELRMFARQHDVQAVAATFEQARRAGFDNISLDLIFGVPHQTLAMWRESVEAALALHPDHLSMYALILEQGTPLTRDITRGSLPTPDDDLAADMYELADSMALQAGLGQYEISNWSRPGAECQHNLQYWRNAPYLGVGAGAHGYAAGLRYQIVRPIQRYIDLAMAQTAPLPFPITPTVEQTESIDTANAMAEHMLTGLRLIHEGVSVAAFERRFGLPMQSVYGAALDQLKGYGLLEQHGDTLRLTARARLLSNQVFLQFMQEVE